MSKSKLSVPPGVVVLWGLALFAAVLVVYRFINGLGSVSNLSDDMPWGLWVGFDFLAGIALAAGGFVLAGTVHLFGGRKFHALSRPAILTAFIGYVLFMCALMIDLGRPWNLFNVIFTGNHLSPMYEVSWCVMFYTIVLFLEFLPVVFERFSMVKTLNLWHSLIPWLIIVMLSGFMLAMTQSWAWTVGLAVILLVWELCMRAGIMPRDSQMPILLIMAGVILSTLHQSSLGLVYLMAPHELHVLWYSPLLPVLFFLSAVMAGPAILIVEALVSEKLQEHKVNFDLLRSLSKALPVLLLIYLFIKIADLAARGILAEILQLNLTSLSWWLEVGGGIIIPLMLFMSGYTRKKGGLFIAVFLVVTGVVWNRINVSIVGIQSGAPWDTYIPRWSEFIVTAGIISAGFLAYRWLTNNFPVRVDVSSL